MKKIYSTVILLTVFMLSSTIAQASDAVLEKLLKLESAGFIYGVKEHIPKYREANIKPSEKVTSYEFFYNSPVEGGNSKNYIQMRGLLITNPDLDNPLEAKMNQVYVGGYSISEIWDKTDDYSIKYDCVSEFAKRYGGNLVVLEHRYFGESWYDGMWDHMEYCNAALAAEDFAYIISTFRNNLFAKDNRMVFSGISKGGIATSIQAVKYPDDADLFVPYSGPWCNSPYDDRLLAYLKQNTYARPEFEGDISCENYTKIVNCISSDPDIRAEYEKWFLAIYGTSPKEVHSYSISWPVFVQDLASYMPRETMRTKMYYADQAFTTNEWAFYIAMGGMKYGTEYEDSLKAHPEAGPSQSLEYCKQVHAADTGRMTARHMVLKNPADKISKDSILSQDNIIYNYQAKKELGYYKGVLLDSYYRDDEYGQKFKEEDKQMIEKYGNFIDTANGMSRFTYSDALYKEITAGIKTAKRPVIFIYGEDDFWTGAAIEDQYINNSTSWKRIMPAQNHNACISDAPADMQNEIWTYTDAVLNLKTTAINAIVTDKASSTETVKARTVISNGRIVIMRGNKMYNLAGQEM